MLYLGLVLGFVSKNYQGQLCNSVEVHISDSNQTGFLISEDIVGLLAEKKIDYLGVPLFQIDLDKIEKLILSNRIIEKCMAYTSIDGVLHIEINQREPFVRIIDSGGRGFYLDRDGNMLNLSKRFAPHVLVVNGNIRTAFATGQAVNINKLGNERWELRLKEIFELSKFIAGDTFWNAQVVQVYLNNSGEYELVPRIGPHIILLGSIDDYQEKFKKLEIFYKEGLSRVGWNQFIQINLKYKDQVVCTKI
jgi:cell division protein FtsQ